MILRKICAKLSRYGLQIDLQVLDSSDKDNKNKNKQIRPCKIKNFCPPKKPNENEKILYLIRKILAFITSNC